VSKDRYSTSGIDFFIDSLPGVPDNVRVHPHRNSKGKFKLRIVVIVKHQ